jgi:hypothetical protein
MVCFGLTLGLSATVCADPGKTLVLSVEVDGAWHRALQQELEGSLRARGVLVVDSLVSDAERGCRDRSCLLQIGQSLGVLNILVATHYTQSSLLDVFLFESSERIAQKRSEQVTMNDRSARMLALSSSLLKLPEPAAAEPKGVLGWSTLPKWRKGLGIALAVLSASSLATAIAAQSYNGIPWRQSGTFAPGTLDTTPLFVAGYAVAGLSLVGAGLSVFLPSGRTVKEDIQ